MINKNHLMVRLEKSRSSLCPRLTKLMLRGLICSMLVEGNVFEYQFLFCYILDQWADQFRIIILYSPLNKRSVFSSFSFKFFIVKRYLSCLQTERRSSSIIYLWQPSELNAPTASQGSRIVLFARKYSYYSKWRDSEEGKSLICQSLCKDATKDLQLEQLAIIQPLPTLRQILSSEDKVILRSLSLGTRLIGMKDLLSTALHLLHWTTRSYCLSFFCLFFSRANIDPSVTDGEFVKIFLTFQHFCSIKSILKIIKRCSEYLQRKYKNIALKASLFEKIFNYQNFLNKQNQQEKMANITNQQIKNLFPQRIPINSCLVQQQNQEFRIKEYDLNHSDFKIGGFSDKQAHQAEYNIQKQDSHKIETIKIIKNPEIQNPQSSYSKHQQQNISSDKQLPTSSHKYQKLLLLQNNKAQVSIKPELRDEGFNNNEEIAHLKNKASQQIHIRKLKSGFIYSKKSQKPIKQQGKNTAFLSDNSLDLKDLPVSSLTKRISPRKIQIQQMTQILKMLEIRLSSFDSQPERQLIKGIQLKNKQEKSKEIVKQGVDNVGTSSPYKVIPQQINERQNEQITNKSALKLPIQHHINEIQNLQRNKESKSFKKEKLSQLRQSQSGYLQKLNQQQNPKQLLKISIEKQALERQIKRLNKTIKQLMQQKDQSQNSPKIKQRLYNIEQLPSQNIEQIKSPRKHKKKIEKPSSNRLLDAGKIVHLSSLSASPINNNISFSRLAKEIVHSQPSWQVPFLQVQFRDIFVPEIPNAPNVNDSQEQLQRLANKIYGLFGVTLKEGKDLAIRKYKNCVLFEIQNKENSTIIWHFSGKFYFGGWCKKIGQKHGSGLEVVPKKYSYEGQFLKGKRHGSGVLRTFQGQIYDGQWFQGSRHGRGAHLDPTTKAVFNGEWKLNQKEGQGWLKITPKQYYFGLFSKGVKDGFGTEQFSNGDKYRGQYKKGKFHGRGYYCWANGARYQGDFQEGLRQGLGSWYSSQRTDIYIGSYKVDHKSGYGRYISGSGCIYEGQFNNDSRNGKGRLTYPDGTQIKGVWKQGVLVPMQNGHSEHEDRPLTRNNRQFPLNFFATPRKSGNKQH